MQSEKPLSDFQPDRTMNDAIAESAVNHLTNTDVDEYRPDFSTEDRMRHIQAELAARGINTIMKIYYRRGDETPTIPALKKVDGNVTDIYLSGR